MIESLLAETLQEAVEGLRPGPELLVRAQTGRRRRARRRAALAGGVGTVLLAGGAVAVSQPGRLGPLGGSSAARHTAGGQASAAVVTPVPSTPVAALTSFSIRLRNWAEMPGRPDQAYADFTGRYDPQRRVGTGRNTIDRTTIPVRLVGDRWYTQGNPPTWDSSTGTLVDALVLDGGRHWGPSELTAVDAQSLFRRIGSLGDLRPHGTTGHGAAALDDYTFGYRLPADDSVQAHEVTGTVQVHHGSGLLARITWSTGVVGPDPAVADGVPLTFRTEISFSDYGVAVDVRPPPADLVRYTPPRSA